MAAPSVQFWLSDAVLLAVQAGTVLGPRPQLPGLLRRLRGSWWAWALLPASLAGTIALLAAVPSLAEVYAWVAVIGVPVLGAVALASWRLAGAGRERGAWMAGIAAAAVLGVVAWRAAGLVSDAAAVTLTALSACALASWLAGLVPARVLRAALVVMAVLDALLVFGGLLDGPNRTLNAAGVGESLPHFQVAAFGHALIGYGDLLVAAVLGCVLAGSQESGWPPRWVGAVLVLGLSVPFDVLFLVVDSLPATVPVALALGVCAGLRRPRDRAGDRAGRRRRAMR